MRGLGAIVLCVMVAGFATPAAAQDAPSVMANGNVGLRLGVDYLRVMAKDDGELLEGNDVNGFSFKIGVTFGIGSR